MTDFTDRRVSAMNFWKQQEGAEPGKTLSIDASNLRHSNNTAVSTQPTTPTQLSPSSPSPSSTSPKSPRKSIKRTFPSLRKKNKETEKDPNAKKDRLEKKLKEEKLKEEKYKLKEEEKQKLKEEKSKEKIEKQKQKQQKKDFQDDDTPLVLLTPVSTPTTSAPLSNSAGYSQPFTKKAQQQSLPSNAFKNTFQSAPASTTQAVTVTAPQPTTPVAAQKSEPAEQRKWKIKQDSQQSLELIVPDKPQKPVFTSKDQRENIVYEIYSTESDYVEDLNTIMNVFLIPLREIISPEEISKLFNTVELLLPLHIEFLKQLSSTPCICAILKTKVPLQAQGIGECFVTMSQYFKMYNQYCSNQQIANRTFDHLKKSNDEFCEFLEYSFHKPECRKLDLPAFLIKPMQRVCKYPLLLRELEKNTPKYHKDYTSIVKALELVSGTVSIINASTRQQEEAEELLKIQHKITYSKKFPQNDFPIMAPGRRLVEKGTCIYVSPKFKQHTVRWYLLNDILVITKSGVLIKYLPHSSCLIGHVSIIGVDFAFEIIQAGAGKTWIGAKDKAELDNLRRKFISTGMIDRSSEAPVVLSSNKLKEYSARPIPLPPGVDYTTALGIKSQKETLAIPPEFNDILKNSPTPQVRSRASTTSATVAPAGTRASISTTSPYRKDIPPLPAGSKPLPAIPPQRTGASVRIPNSNFPKR